MESRHHEHLPEFCHVHFSVFRFASLERIVYYAITRAWAKHTPREGYAKRLGIPRRTWARWKTLPPITQDLINQWEEATKDEKQYKRIIKVNLRALLDRKMTRAAKTTYLALQCFAFGEEVHLVGENKPAYEDTAICNPLIGSLAKKVGRSRDLIKRGLVDLDTLRWAIWMNNGRHASTYLVGLEYPLSEEDIRHANNEEVCHNCTLKCAITAPDSVPYLHPYVCHNCTTEGLNLNPETRREKEKGLTAGDLLSQGEEEEEEREDLSLNVLLHHPCSSVMEAERERIERERYQSLQHSDLIPGVD